MGERVVGLKARWVFPVSSEPIRDGIIWTEGGRIVGVGQARAEKAARDLGNVAILPGLVNAHTHLELSGFREPVGYRGIPFVDWIRAVISARREQSYDPVAAVRRGMRESLKEGVAAIAEIAQPGWHAEPFSSEGGAAGRCRPTVFLELVGPTRERSVEALQSARKHVDAAAESGDWSPGISPHAPYSVRPELIEGACGISRDCGVPLAMHLAESREEVQLLRSGSGPFRDLLEQLGAWDGAIHPGGRRARDYLEMLSAAHIALIVHGNYLDADEIAYLAGQREKMAVVYCPRTHAWFDHPPYPLGAMLHAGVAVTLGTDSRASSPDLSMLAEIRFAAKTHRQVPPARILEMATINGAKAMNLDREYGTLEPGKLAALTTVGLGTAPVADPYRLLMG